MDAAIPGILTRPGITQSVALSVWVQQAVNKWDCLSQIQTSDSVSVQAECLTVRLVCTQYRHRTPVFLRTPGIHAPPSRCVQLCTTTTNINVKYITSQAHSIIVYIWCMRTPLATASTNLWRHMTGHPNVNLCVDNRHVKNVVWQDGRREKWPKNWRCLHSLPSSRFSRRQSDLNDNSMRTRRSQPTSLCCCLLCWLVMLLTFNLLVN